MGLLALNRLIIMSTHQEDRRRRRTQGRNGLIGSLAKRKGSPCQQEDNSQAGKRLKYSRPHLPEDIWCHIHSLVPLRDAARAASVSRAFLRSWRCHPNLTFSKEMMGLNENARRQGKITRDYNKRIDHVLKNHSGVGVKTLSLEFYGPYDANNCYRLDRWLHISVTPGIEGLILILFHNSPSLGKVYYNFPCSLLSDGSGNSIRHLHLAGCAFRPAVGIGCLRSLTRISLSFVHITGDELGCLLSNSFALEELALKYCDEIISVKIPILLQRLRCLEVFHCCMLRVIESKAPNISSFYFYGEQVQLSFGESVQVKNVYISHSSVLCYARTMLPSSMPNLETLTIRASGEIVKTPMLPSKFLHLKHLIISFARCAFSPTYDFLSLVSFLDASPSLETFHLQAPSLPWKYDSIFEDSSCLGWMPGHCYDNLRRVKISSFCSSKILVELACHILENTTSLECLTLDLTPGGFRCSDSNFGICYMGKGALVEAHKGLLAIQTYIEGKVPSTVNLNVLSFAADAMPLGPCQVIKIM